jgi:hypothetical protein
MACEDWKCHRLYFSRSSLMSKVYSTCSVCAFWLIACNDSRKSKLLCSQNRQKTLSEHWGEVYFVPRLNISFQSLPFEFRVDWMNSDQQLDSFHAQHSDIFDSTTWYSQLKLKLSRIHNPSQFDNFLRDSVGCDGILTYPRDCGKLWGISPTFPYLIEKEKKNIINLRESQIFHSFGTDSVPASPSSKWASLFFELWVDVTWRKLHCPQDGNLVDRQYLHSAHYKLLVATREIKNWVELMLQPQVSISAAGIDCKSGINLSCRRELYISGQRLTRFIVPIKPSLQRTFSPLFVNRFIKYYIRATATASGSGRQ